MWHSISGECEGRNDQNHWRVQIEGDTMKIKQRKEEDITIIQPIGRLDSSGIPEFSAVVNRTIQEGATKLILDFAQMDYMSSAGIRALIDGYKQITAKKGTMVFCSVNDDLNELFDVVQFDKIFTMYKSEFDALEALM
ncbi:MAG: anti-sigma factor antagonist [Candidatus Omnitrophota bacterium]|jgi:anti-sigma B factor antagonist|nr:MAG: anti-sigma factor antagonist [Candidatus Omnitrophota bacterium]